jgi:hypothetical protein
MNTLALTGSVLAAKHPSMDQAAHRPGRSVRRAWGAAAVLMAGASVTAGCVSVSAPDKPIVIELNINIKQEVVYRLAADAESTIEENAGIF